MGALVALAKLAVIVSMVMRLVLGRQAVHTRYVWEVLGMPVLDSTPRGAILQSAVCNYMHVVLAVIGERP